MANLDDRARRAAARLRAEAEQHVDPEEGLARIRGNAGGARQQRRWSPRLLAAAAAVAVIVAGVAVLATRSGPTPVADAPDTTTAPLPTAVPSTLPDTTTPAPTTLPATTTTEPGTVPPTTAPPPPLTMPLPTLDIPPMLYALDLEGCGLPRCSIATTRDGVLVALDGETETFILDVDAGSEAVTVTPAEPLGEYAHLLAVGPGMVAYVAAMGNLDEAPAMDLVVVALSGERAGQVIERLVGVVDGSGDTDLVPTRDGLVGVGCCGPDTLRPDPEREPLIRWLTPDGAMATDPGPHVSVEWVDGQAYGLLPFAGGVDRQLLPAPSWFRGMPLTAVVGDRDYLVAWWEMDSPGSRLVRVSGAVGLAYEIVVPSELSIVTIDVRGAVVFDGEQFHRWYLPTLAMPQDVTARVSSWLPPDAESASALVDAALDHLRADSGCENPSSAEALVHALSDDRVLGRITHREHCDDSVGGSIIELELVRNAETLTWRLERATSWPLCLRGGTDLCV